MVNVSDSIRFTNVISQKQRFHYKEMNDRLEQFLKDLLKLKVTIKGPLFYAIHNVPMDEMVNMELFMPVEDDGVAVAENMLFHSYYSIEDMISISVTSNFEKHTEVAYKILLDYIEERKLQQATPIYHVISGDETLPYMFVKIGVSEGD